MGQVGYRNPPTDRAFASKGAAFLLLPCNRVGMVEQFGVTPDIMVMAKGLASGFPLSGIAARPAPMDTWTPGVHGGTFGGNPVACARSRAQPSTCCATKTCSATHVGRGRCCCAGYAAVFVGLPRTIHGPCP